jgi:hypothetical protein
MALTVKIQEICVSDSITHTIQSKLKTPYIVCATESVNTKVVVLDACRLQGPCIGKEVWAGGSQDEWVCVFGHVYRNVSTAQLTPANR